MIVAPQFRATLHTPPIQTRRCPLSRKTMEPASVSDSDRVQLVARALKQYSADLKEGDEIRVGVDGDPCRKRDVPSVESDPSLYGVVLSVHRDGDGLLEFDATMEDNTRRRFRNTDFAPDSCWQKQKYRNGADPPSSHLDHVVPDTMPTELSDNDRPSITDSDKYRSSPEPASMRRQLEEDGNNRPAPDASGSSRAALPLDEAPAVGDHYIGESAGSPTGQKESADVNFDASVLGECDRRPTDPSLDRYRGLNDDVRTLEARFKQAQNEHMHFRGVITDVLTFIARDMKSNKAGNKMDFVSSFITKLDGRQGEDRNSTNELYRGKNTNITYGGKFFNLERDMAPSVSDVEHGPAH